MKREDLEILKKAREKESKLNTPSFIAEYPQAMSNELCDVLIDYVNEKIEANPQLNRSDPQASDESHYRKDWHIFIHNLKDISSDINKILSHFLKIYTDEYMGLYHTGGYASFEQKLQVTPPGGGFHNWHCEHSHYVYCDRVLAWMFYLNDIELGGETEFLHQRCRIKPEKGKLVFFPAGFTHCHRGNPPLNNTKYIVTGWFNLSRPNSR